MSTHPLQVPTDRIQFAADSARSFLAALVNVITLRQLADFASEANAMAYAADKEMTRFLLNDLNALAAHKDCVRTLSAKIVLLRDGLVPALKIDWNNPMVRAMAVETMGYIWADLQAMDLRMR